MMRMPFLLRTFILRHLFREWLRTLLAVGGVALGIAVYLGIRISNASVLAAFASTVDAIAGRANLEISAPAPGLDERLFPRIESLPGVEAASPSVEILAPLAAPGGVSAPGGRSAPSGRPIANTLASGTRRRPAVLDAPAVMVVGIDPFRIAAFVDRTHTGANGSDPGDTRFFTDPEAAIIGAPLAHEQGIREGGSISLYAGTAKVGLHILSVMPADPLSRAYGGKLVVMDIAGAQESFNRLGYLDRVSLIVAPERVELVEAALRRFLPSSAVVARPSRRTATVERMLGAFNLNLEALSLIALFVGMFLVYNTLSSAVVRRRGELGILRSLGVTQAGMFGLVLAEALVTGVAGSLLGLVLGYGMARSLLKSVAATVSSLYIRVEVAQIHAPASLIVGVGLLGIGASLLAALAPALDAASIEPAQVVRQGVVLRVSRVRWQLFGGAAFAFLLQALAASSLALVEKAPLLGFVACFAVLGGSSLVAPILCTVCGRMAFTLIHPFPGIALRAGTAFFRASVERVWIVVAALAASVTMLVGLSIMIGSFRLTVGQWVNQTVVGDVYISPAAFQVSGSYAVMPPAAIRAASMLAGVEEVDTYRYIEFPYRDGVPLLEARQLDILRAHARYHVRRGSFGDAVQRLEHGNEVMVSGSFADKFNVREGQMISLPGPGGAIHCRIAAVFNDYTSDQGMVLIGLDRYRTLWRDSTINAMALYSRSGTDDLDLARRAEKALGGYSLVIRTNSELRGEILKIFDQTFQVTYALEVVAVLVALFGIASTLITLLVQRSRQFATLRALGASRGQLSGAIMVEATLIAVVAWVLGALAGSALAEELIRVVLPGFFHWTVEPAFGIAVYLWSLALMVLAALAAAALPALAASRAAIGEGLRTDH